MKLRHFIFPAVLILALAFSYGCASKKKATSEMTDEPVVGVEDVVDEVFELNGDSDSGKAGTLKTVNFAFDSSQLSGKARSILEKNALFLKATDSVEIQVEGHCDERGGVQYNLALGERRAKAVRDYLVALGIESSRITTISFGKERPISFGHDEDSWGENRRANFVITAK